MGRFRQVVWYPVTNRGRTGKKGCTLDWQVRDISAICGNGASCHMSYSYTGVINYHEAKTFMKTASGTRYPIEGCGDLP